jgi:uncharacterized protein YndB with AHSA1/START domain
MTEPTLDRSFQVITTVAAGIEAVWEAWTTEAGVAGFFGPAGHIELAVDGAYEIYFDQGAPPGKQGSEGMRILAIQPGQMLRFTWNAPLTMPELRGQLTQVEVSLWQLAPKLTRVTLTHTGWGEGSEWDTAYAYFTKMWKDGVLPRLRYRFEVGPVDWEHPPRFLT